VNSSQSDVGTANVSVELNALVSPNQRFSLDLARRIDYHQYSVDSPVGPAPVLPGKRNHDFAYLRVLSSGFLPCRP